MAKSGPDHILDLAQMGLGHGEGRRLEIDLAADSLTMGGQEYAATEDGPARLEISRPAQGYALHLSFSAEVHGPCVRCLGPASISVDVDAREVDQPGTGDPELRSPYLSGEELDAGRWAHDSLVLAVPQRLLCRPDCAGLCPVCGVSLNDANPADHEHAQARDPRFAKLDELKLE